MLSQTEQATSSLPDAASAAASGQTAAAPPGTRLLFVDNLRTMLIAGVVVVHVAAIYAAAQALFEYHDPSTDLFTGALLTVLAGIGNAWAMGLFFFLAGYFTPGTYQRKGGAAFLRDRFMRLGIPLLLYDLLMEPLVIYLAWGLPGSYWRFYSGYLPHVGEALGLGPVWFLEVLLCFSLLYAVWRRLTRWHAHQAAQPGKLPGLPTILGGIILLGVVSFVVRLWWPGYSRLFNLPAGYFPQYIGCYLLGLVAYRRNWIVALTPRMGKAWLRTAIIALVVPVLLAIPVIGDQGAGLNALLGGFYWQALVEAVWEALMVVAVSIGLLVLFRVRWNHQGKLAKRLADSAYAAYLIHAVIVVGCGVALQPVPLYPLLEFVIVVLVALPLSFLLGSMIRKIPFANRVL